MHKLTPRTLALALEYHLFKKDKALLKWLVPAKVQGMLRRRARARYLVWDARRYNLWMKAHLAARQQKYSAALEPGLLSIATPVWDGTPISYLRLLAESIAAQNIGGACEWLVLDNGCTKPDVCGYLEDLSAKYGWVKLHREATNQGIVGGLRACLEQASGRYMCTVDSDDLLYPDCLQIVQWWIQHSGFPPLLYSDEDKIIGAQPVQPYLKPDFDPVLLLNSAYIAHLGVVERVKALELGAYSDRNAEGSPDWDCFVRFYVAGYEAVHIPEVIYSWRMHPESTADDAGSKPYIHSSQRAVLGRYLEARDLGGTFEIRYSPLLPGTADWWIERKHLRPGNMLLLSDGTYDFEYPDLKRGRLPSAFNELVECVSGVEFVCVLKGNLRPERADGLWEALGLFERFSDAVMVGGWIANGQGQVADGPLVLGFGNGCGCPDAGRPVVDPGHFTQMRKQRSVSAISSGFCVIRTDFLRRAFSNGGFHDVAIAELGPYLGQFAREAKQRIVFSPFLRAEITTDEGVNPMISFSAPADHRYYPEAFGMTPETAYQLGLRQ